jgi:hypothetical protein
MAALISRCEARCLVGQSMNETDLRRVEVHLLKTAINVDGPETLSWAAASASNRWGRIREQQKLSKAVLDRAGQDCADRCEAVQTR